MNNVVVVCMKQTCSILLKWVSTIVSLCTTKAQHHPRTSPKTCRRSHCRYEWQRECSVQDCSYFSEPTSNSGMFTSGADAPPMVSSAYPSHRKAPPGSKRSSGKPGIQPIIVPNGERAINLGLLRCGKERWDQFV